MSNADKLKKRAAEFESKRQNDKAIATYLELFDEWDGEDLANIEVGLYNRAGDIMLREGKVADAVSVWERAVDLYAEGGFQNNAIALCNKILRNTPGRASVYYKLGKISAQKGFRGDAKKNFLEYADRKQKANEIDEAFRALKEFADLCPDEDDIRQMLADQLSKLGRTEEALEQLQLLYGRYVHLGDQAAATATLERMKAIDPSVEPSVRGPRRSTVAKGLVFLDLEEPQPGARAAAPAPPSAPAPAPQPAQAPPVVPLDADVLVDLDDAGLLVERDDDSVVAPMSGLEPTAVDSGALDDSVLAPSEDVPAELGDGSLLGLETTAIDGADVDVADELVTLEPLEIEGQGIDTDVPPADGLELIPEFVADDVARPEDAEDERSVGADLEFIVPDESLDDDDEPSTDSGSSLSFIDLDDDEDPVAAPSDAVGLLDVEDEDPAYTDLPMLEDVPIPRRATRSTMAMMAESAEVLGARLADDPENWQLRREYAEALLDAGERGRGIAELEAVLAGFEGAGDLESARSVADELIRLSPHSVRLHQKRVEYAVRLADRPRLLEAYLQLADALFQAGQPDKARVVYERVLELAPDDVRAAAAVQTLGAPAPLAAEPPPADVPPAVVAASTSVLDPHRESAPPAVSPPAVALAAAPTAVPTPPLPAAADDEFVSLGDWLREDEGPKSTRMVVDEEAPSGDEDADFKDMLRKFKQGVADNVEEEDHESHYDLGVAFKEMGLVDEAIAEFQKALRGTANRARTFEALGQCFVEKGQTQVAMTILQRALSEPGAGDDQLVGVLYLLGDGAEVLGQPADAIRYFQRVFAVDITFRDVGDRLNRLEQARA